MKLTVKRIERLTEPGRHGDGGGLYLRVAPGGSKQWILRVVAKGRRQDVGLGGFPATSIQEARDRAFELRRIARRGGDPLALVQSSKVPTFAEAAAATLETHRPRWREATINAFMPVLDAHAKALTPRPVDSIARADVIDCLKGADGSTRDKLRLRLTQVFDYCAAYGYIEDSPVPTNGTLAAVMNVKRERKNHAAMKWSDVPAFFAALPQTTAGACMAFLILCGVRSNEARGAKWTEIDTGAATWTIPADRMKSKRQHAIPLSPAAVAILESMPRRGQYVFAGRKAGSTLSDETLRSLVRDRGVTTHGMRSALRTWCQEHGVARDVAEAALAHVVAQSSTEAAYARSDLFDARRPVMDRWGDYVAG